MFEDPGFWVFVGFVIFVAGLVYLKVPNMITNKLDQRANDIEKQIDQVVSMKNQAQTLLNEYQSKRNNVQKEIDNIIKKTRKTADEQNQLVISYTEKSISQIKNTAQNRMKQMYQDDIAGQRQKIALIALNAATNIINQNKNNINQDELIDVSIDKLETKL